MYERAPLVDVMCDGGLIVTTNSNIYRSKCWSMYHRLVSRPLTQMLPTAGDMK
jgi:hypothetical protein